MLRQVAAAKELDSYEVCRTSLAWWSFPRFPFFQEEVELPADWVPGDKSLPTSLEEKKAFLGLLEVDEMRDVPTMGEPKVKQVLPHYLSELYKPRFWTLSVSSTTCLEILAAQETFPSSSRDSENITTDSIFCGSLAHLVIFCSIVIVSCLSSREFNISIE